MGPVLSRDSNRSAFGSALHFLLGGQIMTPDERANLILTSYVNGQATDHVIAAGWRFAARLGIRAELLPHGANCNCGRRGEA
jgi:hypothetical protein